MNELFSLGDLYVSDFLAPDEQPRAEPFELKLMMDDDGLVHLEQQPPPELMWGTYWYQSGTNQTMTRELHGIVEQVNQLVHPTIGDLWVDIASNDGTLLAAIDRSIIRIGVDPASDKFAAAAREHADAIMQEPFTLSTAGRIVSEYGQANVVTCIAMFYDLMDPTDFLDGINHLLAMDGVLVLQMSYTPLMLTQLAFDNICHEHARYYTMYTLKNVLEDAGFKIMDVQLNDTNGGSFRVYVMHAAADETTFASAPYRDVASTRRESLLVWERENDMNYEHVWYQFFNRIEMLKTRTVSFIRGAIARGETVWGYGASTKGNTLLQYFGLDEEMITAIAERQKAKVGLRTIGTDIPIVDEQAMRIAAPNYLLMLPWHFVSEFRRRESAYLTEGGKFIVPCPNFEIISE